MRRSRRRWIVGTIAVMVVALGSVIVGAWVVPGVIAGQLRSQFHGDAMFAGWWLGVGSGGVSRLSLHETPEARSPVWLSAEKVETDLSFARIFTGRLAPSRISLKDAKLRLRFGRGGQILTKGPFSGDPKATKSIPDVEVINAEVTIEQEGRPPMVIGGVSGLLDRSEDAERLRLASDDPSWGKWTVEGQFEPDFKSGSVRLASGPGFTATPARTSSVPFVPTEVWENVSPTGPVAVAVTFALDKSPAKAFSVHTDLNFLGTTTDLPSLKVVAKETTGRMTVDDGLVRLIDLKGLAVGGSLGASGTLDFRGASPSFAIDLKLKGIDVASTPPDWQLAEVGATGKLSGQAQIKVALTPSGPDLSGSSGDAVIDGATLQGIAIKSLRLGMRAVGEDLQFESKPESKSSIDAIPLGLILIGLQNPVPAKPDEPKPPEAPKFRLPKAITTQIELQDVDLVHLIQRLEALTKIKIPVPIAGHLAMKAEATIPLGSLGELKGYRFRGDATLTGASIDGVDLGRVAGHIDLNEGILQIEKLRGQLVERPDGGVEAPPPSTAPLPVDGPLTPGAFRGTFRAELSPPGRLTAHFDGESLPLGEILAPYLPRPTPAAGRVTTSFDASADIANLGDARAWSARGKVASRQLSYKGASLDEVATSFTIVAGKVDLPDLHARLGGHPLKSKLAIDMASPRAFSGQIDVEDWAIERVLALLPNAPKPAPATGRVDARVAFHGTVSPPMLVSEGKILVHDATVESMPLGDVVANWVTEGNDVRVKEIQARPFSGRLTGDALIPATPDRPIRLRIDLTSVNTSQLAQALTHGSLVMTGPASGRLVATVPFDLKGMVIDLKLDAPTLTIQGVPAGTVAIVVREKDNMIEYEANADGPDGKVRFKGKLPLLTIRSGAGTATDAELRAAGFSLADVWALLGVKAPAKLLGRAAIDANLRVQQTAGLPFGIHGNLEVRDLSWGLHYPLGNLRGVLARTPTAWRIDTIRGDLLGGEAIGMVTGETPVAGPRTMNFELETDRASIRRVFSFVPSLAKRVEGYGTVRLHGQMTDVLRMTADVVIARGKLAGLPISEVRLPAEMSYNPAQGDGIIHARRWSARVGGGRVLGNAWTKLGTDRSFSTDLTLTDLDIESIARVETNAARPGSGKVNGRIILNGPDPSLSQRYRGRINLTLTDASLVDIPVIRELGRFLGAVQGGAFEQGELRASIGNRQIFIEEMTLEGRILQIHAVGAVGFNGALDLGVLVNTNQIIPQTGQALISIIPGLRDVVGRNEEALLRVSNFLSNRLLKFRISGTIKNPNVVIDPGVVVTDAAAGFFSGVLKLPFGFAK